MSHVLYDQIGKSYTSTRHPDPRIGAAIVDALGGAERVVNVGAGAGAYEPASRFVVAVEPSQRMIQQRSRTASSVVQASAEALPFRAGTFDAALAVLTLHHWTDWHRGLSEMKRVADRVVIFTFEPGEVGNFWLTEAYFPEIIELDQGRCPSVADIVNHLGECRVVRIPIPHDCVDGFLAAFWRRPEAYLDPAVRAGISGFARLNQDVIARGVARLRSDLESGAWEQRFGHIRSLDALDVCYRLVVVDSLSSTEHHAEVYTRAPEGGSMSEQDNRALVGRGYDAFGRGDIEALLALLDENVEWITPGPSDLPTAGRRRGRQEVAEFFKGVDSLFEVQRFEPESFISEGDRVVVLGSETTRVKATGKVLDMRWAHVFTVRNGKVAVLEEFQDTSAIVAELRDAQSRA